MHTRKSSQFVSLLIGLCFVSIVRSQVINEVLGNSGPNEEDWIELYNQRSAFLASDTSGTTFFSLSDKSTPKFSFKLVVASQGYWTVNRFNNGVQPFFGNDTITSVGFGISSAGESIYLFDYLGAIVDTVTFGGARPGQSYGRWRTARGLLRFTLLSRSTKGAVNAYPHVGQVVLTEIMAQPSGVKPQWISILNRGSTTVKLYDSADPAKAPWKIKGVDMTFPPNQELLAGQTAFICAASVSQATFETEWSTLLARTPTPKIFCNWNGTLRTTDQLAVLSSLYENTDPLNPVLYVPEDTVTFNASSVPVGTSLKRVNLASYGDEPLNWESSTRIDMQGNCTTRDDCLKVDNCTLVDCVSSMCTYTMSTVPPICAAAQPTPTPVPATTTTGTTSTSSSGTTPTPTPASSSTSTSATSGSPRGQSVTSVIAGIFFTLALLKCLH